MNDKTNQQPSGITVGELIQELSKYPPHYDIELMIHTEDGEPLQVINNPARGVFNDEEIVYIESWYPSIKITPPTQVFKVLPNGDNVAYEPLEVPSFRSQPLDVTGEFVECFSDESNRTGAMWRMIRMGHIPEGVNPLDAQVLNIMKAAQEEQRHD